MAAVASRLRRRNSRLAFAIEGHASNFQIQINLDFARRRKQELAITDGQSQFPDLHAQIEQLLLAAKMRCPLPPHLPVYTCVG